MNDVRFRFSPRESQEQNQERKLDAAKRNLHDVRNHWLMILRQERFDEARPHEHDANAENQRDEIGRDGTHTLREPLALAPADERVGQYEPGLASDQDGWNFDHTVRHEPAEQKFGLPGADVIERDRTEDNTVIEQRDDRADRSEERR